MLPYQKEGENYAEQINNNVYLILIIQTARDILVSLHHCPYWCAISLIIIQLELYITDQQNKENQYKSDKLITQNNLLYKRLNILVLNIKTSNSLSIKCYWKKIKEILFDNGFLKGQSIQMLDNFNRYPKPEIRSKI